MGLIRRSWLNFSPINTEQLLARTQVPFQPLGLMIWDPPKASNVTLRIGIETTGSASSDGIPAEVFTERRNFQELANEWVEFRSTLASWLDVRVINPNVFAWLEFSVLFDNDSAPRAAFWGYDIR